MATRTIVALSHSKLLVANKDSKKAVVLSKLVYVNDSKPGIERFKSGKGYIYKYRNKRITERATIERIQKLAIPPSWSNVWICSKANGHIQSTGLDLKKRKQYRYHTAWNELKNETKFHHLFEFGQVLPKLRRKISKDIKQKELTQDKVLAVVLGVMEQTYIRVGSSEYEKMYGSYGLTTLKDKHASIKKDKIEFCFVGKKGVLQKTSLKNKRLARAVKECQEVPGKELFQYYDKAGNRKSVDATMVNNYIKSATGDTYSAKDFRTWAGSLHMLKALKKIGPADNATITKKNIIEAFDLVKDALGNTRTVCKKYYVHPGIVKLYEENKLDKYLDQIGSAAVIKGLSSLSKDEKVLMKILKKS